MDANLFLEELIKIHPTEQEFHQAVREVLESIEEIYNQNPQFETHKIIERMVEPDRIIIFRVPWSDDSGEIQVNRGYRVEFNSAIGPYKGGLRFHPEVSLSNQNTMCCKLRGIRKTAEGKAVVGNAYIKAPIS